jgi:hypothetical protein
VAGGRWQVAEDACTSSSLCGSCSRCSGAAARSCKAQCTCWHHCEPQACRHTGALHRCRGCTCRRAPWHAQHSVRSRQQAGAVLSAAACGAEPAAAHLQQVGGCPEHKGAHDVRHVAGVHAAGLEAGAELAAASHLLAQRSACCVGAGGGRCAGCCCCCCCCWLCCRLCCCCGRASRCVCRRCIGSCCLLLRLRLTLHVCQVACRQAGWKG